MVSPGRWARFRRLLNDPNYIQVYLKKVESLTPAEILKVARKYLRPENLTMTLMINKADAKLVSKKKFEKMASEVAQVLKLAQKKKLKRLRKLLRNLRP